MHTTTLVLRGHRYGTGASNLDMPPPPKTNLYADVDKESLKHATRNVELNNLQTRIKILPRKFNDKMIPLNELGLRSMDFAMTNPPFYESDKELLKSAEKKARPPHSACTGAPIEMVCEGGEVVFVRRILEESLVLRERVQWYTAMLGKISSLEILVDKLREEMVGNYAVTEFIQGAKTRRWAIAWSFCPMRPAQDVSRGMKAVAWRKVLPDVCEHEVLMFPVGSGIGKMAHTLAELIGSLELISWEWNKELLHGIGRARENVWSRAWRRKKQREQADGKTPGPMATDQETCVFGFSVCVRARKDDAAIECRWREGHEEAIFMSFCGFVKTRLQAAQGNGS